MSTNIWIDDLYSNHNIPYIFNTTIYEYDMKDAGFSLTKELKLLDENTINKLNGYKKDKRKVELGLIQRNDKQYTSNLKTAFQTARHIFFEENKLEESDVIDIKKDAIFTTKLCPHNTFGKYIDFRIKNEYSSYIRLDKRTEFFYNSNTLDIKGMSDENIEYHKDYMISFISRFMNKMETSSEIDVIEFTKRFIDKYKRKELDAGYYRTFNHESCFKYLDNDEMIFMEYIDDLDNLDISYNFKNILLKLIQIPL